MDDRLIVQMFDSISRVIRFIMLLTVSIFGAVKLWLMMMMMRDVCLMDVELKILRLITHSVQKFRTVMRYSTTLLPGVKTVA